MVEVRPLVDLGELHPVALVGLAALLGVEQHALLAEVREDVTIEGDLVAVGAGEVVQPFAATPTGIFLVVET